eukprot:scaffold19768_cov19-Tisochrysis_lutea.AAC.2
MRYIQRCSPGTPDALVPRMVASAKCRTSALRLCRSMLCGGAAYTAVRSLQRQLDMQTCKQANHQAFYLPTEYRHQSAEPTLANKHQSLLHKGAATTAFLDLPAVVFFFLFEKNCKATPI